MNNVKHLKSQITLASVFPELGFSPKVAIDIPAFPSRFEIPSYDKNYKPNQKTLKQALMWLLNPQDRGLWCFGPPGTGKTELFHYICGKLGLPLMVISATPDTRVDKLQGKFVLTKDGDSTVTTFELAAIAEAMKFGVPIILDEGDKLTPETAAALHRPAELKPWLVEDTKEVIKPSKFFRLIVCANTNGRDMHPAFPASQEQDDAFLDRFDFIHFDYLAPSQEIEVLKSIYPEVGLNSLSLMVKAANLLRDATFGASVNGRRDFTQSSGVNAKVTLRTLKAWLGHSRMFGHNELLIECLKPCFLNGLDNNTFDALVGQNGLLHKALGEAINMTVNSLDGK